MKSSVYYRLTFDIVRPCIKLLVVQDFFSEDIEDIFNPPLLEDPEEFEDVMNKEKSIGNLKTTPTQLL